MISTESPVVQVMDTPYGLLLLEGQDGHLIRCVWTDLPEPCSAPSPLLVCAMNQLDEYFRGRRTCFDLPILPKGTVFQKKVWQAVQDIPYGTTRSYGDLAEQAGCPKAVRAVGTAIGKNPLCMVIPCHRVISASGKTGGYSGGEKRKKALLEFEIRS